MKAERGAIIIQVAVCLLALMAFSAIVLDYGILWTSRAQAQNAADAAALAGMITLQQDPTAGATARDVARAAVRANPIWNEALANGDITVSWPLPSRCPDGTDACIKVDVFRGGLGHTNALPTIFGNLVGITRQGINATATAEILNGNASSCLRPWLIPDGWEEHSVPANLFFDYGVDIYRDPTPGPSTGYTKAMIGQTVILTAGDPHDAVAPGNYYEADLTGGGGGTPDYIHDIEHCSGVLKHINPYDPPACPLGDADQGCVNILTGRRPNASAEGAQYLVDQDPGATIDSSGVIHGSCAFTNSCTGAYAGATFSPRVVPVALFDPVAYTLGDRTSGNLDLPVVNIMAFFIQSVVSTGPNKGQITAVLCDDAAIFDAGGGTAPGGQFLTVVGLIR